MPTACICYAIGMDIRVPQAVPKQHLSQPLHIIVLFIIRLQIMAAATFHAVPDKRALPRMTGFGVAFHSNTPGRKLRAACRFSAFAS